MTSKTIAGLVLAFIVVASNGIGRRAGPAVVEARRSPAPRLGTVTPIDAPGAANTLALDINAAGVIVGRFGSGGHTHGFMRSAAGDFTVIDVPGASLTVATSINDVGDIVGQYAVATAPSQRQGFLLKDGVFTTFNPTGSTFTNPLGINERGDIVGRYCVLVSCRLPGNGDFRGFLLRDGVFTTIDVPGAIETDPFKANGRDQIAGGFVLPSLEEQIFVLSNGTFTALATPGGQPVAMDDGGFNERGDVVGTSCDGAPPCQIALVGTHGFLMSAGQFTAIDISGASATAANGINARGEIVGSYGSGGAFHGFLLSQWVYQAGTPAAHLDRRH